jgi:hypothetical protein
MSRERKYKTIAVAEGFILILIFFGYATYRLPDIINFISRLNPEVGLKDELIAKQEKIIQDLQFDKIRGEDLTNILLAIQDFINEKDVIPSSLQELNDSGYLKDSENLTDPATDQPYYFKTLEDDFILCVFMSDRIKGVNVSRCPASRALDFISPQAKTLDAQLASVIPESYQKSRWLFTIFWTIWSLSLFFLLRRTLS